MVSYAEGSRMRLAYVAESAWATIPSTPTFNILRLTNNGLRGTKQTTVSDEIRDDRNVPEEMVVGRSASGTIEGEFPYGHWDTLMQAALMGSWNSNVLKVGTTFRSFTIEETNQLDGADSYARFTGMVVNSFGLSAEARQKIKATFGFIGKKEDHSDAGTAISGATYAARNAELIPATAGSITINTFTASNSFAATPKLLSFNFNLTNNASERPVVDDEYTIIPKIGRADVTGEIVVYFSDKAQYEAIDRHSTGVFEFTIGTVTNKKYKIKFPRIQFLDGERIGRSMSEDIKVRMPFRATYDSSDDTSMKITRAVA